MSCGAILSLGDDFGDNSSTFCCQLPEKHVGLHQEKFNHYGRNNVTLTWEKDERIDDRDYCPYCLEKAVPVHEHRDLLGVRHKTFQSYCEPCNKVFCRVCWPEECLCIFEKG